MEIVLFIEHRDTYGSGEKNVKKYEGFSDIIHKLSQVVFLPREKYKY